MKSLGSQSESIEFLKGFYGCSMKGSIGISVGIRWGFNEIISIWISTMIQWYPKGVLLGIDGDCKGVHMDAIGCL